MMINISNLHLLAHAAEWVQKTEQIAKISNVDVLDDHDTEFSFMNYMKELGTEKPSSLDFVAFVPSETPKPYVSDLTLTIPNNLKRSLSEFNDSLEPKRQKLAKESNSDDDHPFLVPLPPLVIIPPRPRPQQGPPVLPVEFRNEIARMRGIDIQFIIQRVLTPTDVRKNQACLSVPVSQINDSNFLTEIERADLKTKIEGKPYQLAVPLIDPELRHKDVSLRWRGMPKPNGTSNPKYVLTTGWTDLVTTNNFHAGEVIQLWSFRVRFENEDLPPPLHFALVRV